MNNLLTTSMLFVLMCLSSSVRATDVDVDELGLVSKNGYIVANPDNKAVSYWIHFAVSNGVNVLCVGVPPSPQSITCVDLNDLDQYRVESPAEIVIDPEQQDNTG